MEELASVANGLSWCGLCVNCVFGRSAVATMQRSWHVVAIDLVLRVGCVSRVRVCWKAGLRVRVPWGMADVQRQMHVLRLPP